MRHAILITLLLLSAVSFFAQRATLDLRDWNVPSKRIIKLDNNWELYWNKLLAPEDFKRDSSLTPDALVRPVSWNDTKLNGKPLGGKGYATYRLLLKNLPSSSLMLDVYSVQTSCRVYINDSLMLEIGRPGTDLTSTIPMNRDGLITIPGNTKDVQVIVQVANFHHRKGGFVHPFELGLSSAIIRHHMLFYMFDVVESAALVILGLFLLALYTFRRKDLSILYFAVFCITLSLRPVIAVNYLLSTLFPGISWALLLKMEYLGVLFPCLFMLLFIKKLFPEQLSMAIVKILGVILSIKIIITIFFPPSVFSYLIPPLLIIIPLGVLVFTITIIKAVMAKEEGASQAGLGLIVLLASLVLKVLVYANIIPQIEVLITGLDIAFIFMMSLILGARFSLQFARVERLQQTTELQHREIEKSKMEIEEQNKSIIDSINYAKRIQQSLLPTEKYIERTLKKMMDKIR